ncbi:MAG: hypothetical protein ACK5CH_07930 [Bacteroidota bacterium]
MLKVIVVDDEPLALDVLETYISKIPQLELVGRYSTPSKPMRLSRIMRLT